MPTDTEITVSIIDPVSETVDELERAIERDIVHIQGIEIITGRKTFTDYVTAPEFRGTLRGGIVDGILLGPLNLNGQTLTGLGGLGFEALVNKGTANGYAPLGPTALVPAANLGTGGSGGGTNFLADDGQYRPISAGAVSFGTQAANLVFAGPGSGGAAAPAFRILEAADIPMLPQSKITDLVTDLAGKVPTTRTITEGAGLAGNVYDLSVNRTLALGIPSLLSVGSANSVSGTTHSHAITSSSNPGAAASLLATDGSGFLTIPRLTLTDRLLINALVANLYLKDTSTGFQAAATGIITPQSGNIWRNTSYTSGIRGWNINDDGDAEFNNIRARGEIASSVFKVNEIAATAGTFGVFKSAANLQADVTTPASTSSSFGFSAKNSDAGGMLFEVNDIVRFKTWTGAGISDAWATITARVNQGTYTNYTATLNSGSTTATFRAGTAVVDWGPSGTGVITLSADGTIGSSPNLTMATHAGSPWSSQTTLLRAGNLNGSFGYATNVYGVGIGQYGAAQSWLTFDTTNGLRIGNNTTVLAGWEPTGAIVIGQVAAGLPNINIDTTNGLRFRMHNTTTRLQLATDGSGFLANSLISWDATGNLTVSGNATIGGFSIGSDYIRDNANSFGLASTVTGGDDVRFWAGNTFANRATAPFRLTEAGNLFASNATITGSIIATSGAIGGWTVGSSAVVRDTGTASTSAGLEPNDFPFYAGSTYANRASAPFRITSAGALTASNATITGAITATSGSVTGIMSVTGSGSFRAGDGNVILDSTGLTLTAFTGESYNRIKWMLGSDVVGIVANYSGVTGSIAVRQSQTAIIPAANSTWFAESSLTARNNVGQTTGLTVGKLGSSHASGGNIGYVDISGGGNFAGVLIGSLSGGLPTHMLDVYGDITSRITTNDAGILLQGATTGIHPVFKIANSGGTVKSRLGIAGAAGGLVAGSATGDLVIRAESQAILFSADGGGGVAMKITAGNVVEVRVGGVLKAVEVGAADSGGAGYKMLRVLN